MIPFRWRTHSLWLRWLAALTPKDSTRIEVRVSSTHNGRDKLFSLQGSLTTPKCNPAVTWIIFPDTIPISLNQIAKFRTLSNGIEGLLLVDNFRHLQPIGNRKVFLRSVASRSTSLEKVLMSEPHEDSNDEDPSFWYFNWSAKRIHNPIKNIRRTIYSVNFTRCQFMFHSPVALSVAGENVLHEYLNMNNLERSLTLNKRLSWTANSRAMIYIYLCSCAAPYFSHLMCDVRAKAASLSGFKLDSNIS